MHACLKFCFDSCVLLLLSVLIVLVLLLLESASVKQIDKAKEVIKKLTFNFQSDAFENPSE